MESCALGFRMVSETPVPLFSTPLKSKNYTGFHYVLVRGRPWQETGSGRGGRKAFLPVFRACSSPLAAEDNYCSNLWVFKTPLDPACGASLWRSPAFARDRTFCGKRAGWILILWNLITNRATLPHFRTPIIRGSSSRLLGPGEHRSPLWFPQPWEL